MGIDAVDTAKSTFGSLTTETGLKVIGLLFVVQLANMLGSMAYQTGMTGAAIGGLVTILAAIASVLISVGALRSFDTESFEKGQYTENMLWPVTRLIGANVTTTVFAYGIGVLLALPIIAIVQMIGLGGIGSGSLIGTAVSSLGLLAALSGFVYVMLTLVLAVPMVAAGNRRLFESLDLSVRRTSGNKRSMFLALLPVAAVYLIAVGLVAWIAPQIGAGNLATGAVSALISSVMATAFFALLTEYNHRLPEE